MAFISTRRTCCLLICLLYSVFGGVGGLLAPSTLNRVVHQIVATDDKVYPTCQQLQSIQNENSHSNNNHDNFSRHMTHISVIGNIVSKSFLFCNLFLFHDSISSQNSEVSHPNSILSITSSPILMANARNLPEDNGASGKQRGSVNALIPLVKLKNNIDQSLESLLLLKQQQEQASSSTSSSLVASFSNIMNDIIKSNKIPFNLSEKEFKRLFDEYSEGVSYKQQYLDKNAFVVYYTQGFDGPNRENIETDTDGSMTKMTQQYGYRNDAWVAVDEAMSEIKYLQSLLKQSNSNNNPGSNSNNNNNDQDTEAIKESQKDLINALKSVQIAMKQYFSLIPPQQLAEAEEESKI